MQNAKVLRHTRTSIMDENCQQVTKAVLDGTLQICCLNFRYVAEDFAEQRLFNCLKALSRIHVYRRDITQSSS